MNRHNFFGFDQPIVSCKKRRQMAQTAKGNTYVVNIGNMNKDLRIIFSRLASSLPLSKLQGEQEST